MKWTSLGLLLFCVFSNARVSAESRTRIEIIPIAEKTDQLQPPPLVGMGDFAHATSLPAPDGSGSRKLLSLELKTEAARRLRAFTAGHVGSRLAFVVDGKLLQAPVIRDEIHGPGVQVGPFEKADAQRLAHAINGD